jgi:hypothetical protein
MIAAMLSSLDGRLVLAETWRWESKPGSGTSLLCELP